MSNSDILPNFRISNVIDHLPSFMKGFYIYWHPENENSSEHNFCMIIHDKLKNILDNLVEIYSPKKFEHNLSYSLKTKEIIQKKDIKSQIEDLISIFDGDPIDDKKKSSERLMKEGLKSYFDLFFTIIPIPLKENKHITPLLPILIELKQKYHLLAQSFLKSENGSIIGFCEVVLQPFISFAKDKLLKFQKILEPIIKSIENISKQLAKKPHIQKIKLLEQLGEYNFGLLPEKIFPDYYTEYNELLLKALNLNRENFIRLSEEFIKCYQNLPSATKYFSTLDIVQNSQHFIFNFEQLSGESDSDEFISNLGKILAKFYYGLKEDVKYHDYIKHKPILQGDDINHDLKYIKETLEKTIFFYGFILGLIDNIYDQFDSSMEEYFTLNRYPLKNTYYYARKIHRNGKWYNLNKCTIKSGLKKIGLVKLEQNLDQINQRSRKMRNFFTHKKGILHQDRLDENLYKIHSLSKGVEYISFKEIREIKSSLASLVPGFITYLWKFIIENNLLIEFDFLDDKTKIN